MARTTPHNRRLQDEALRAALRNIGSDDLTAWEAEFVKTATESSEPLTDEQRSWASHVLEKLDRDTFARIQSEWEPGITAPAWIAPAYDPDVTAIADDEQVARIDRKWPRLPIDEWEGLKPKVLEQLRGENAARAAGNGARTPTGNNGNGATPARRSDPPTPPPAGSPRIRLPGDPAP